MRQEDEPDEGEDQHVAGEHVGVETDGEADQPHDLADDLDRDDEDGSPFGTSGIQLLK